MTTQNTELKAGKLYVFSTGEYSDYSYCGAYVALQDVTEEKIDEIVASINERKEKEEDELGWCEFDVHEAFQAALIREGYIACIDLHEIHIGSYGTLDLC